MFDSPDYDIRRVINNAASEDPVALGYTRDNRFAFVLPKTQQFVLASAIQLTSSQYLMGMAPLIYWTKNYPSDAGAAFSTLSAGNALMQQCRAAGPFNPATIRGRGIWREGNEIIINNVSAIPPLNQLTLRSLACGRRPDRRPSRRAFRRLCSPLMALH